MSRNINAELPILFNAPMVRAVLNDTKTITRRIAKLTDAAHVKEPRGHRRWHPADPEARLACPYGQPGDRLWVREAWRACRDLNRTAPRDIDPDSSIEYEATKRSYAEIGLTGKLRQSMFMPRWASRITLEITLVRIERLQDISEADSLREGIAFHPGYDGYCLPDGSHFHCTDPRISYWSLWESINGAGSVEANPWVWVVEFKRITS